MAGLCALVSQPVSLLPVEAISDKLGGMKASWLSASPPAKRTSSVSWPDRAAGAQDALHLQSMQRDVGRAVTQQGAAKQRLEATQNAADTAASQLAAAQQELASLQAAGSASRSAALPWRGWARS